MNPPRSPRKARFRRSSPPTPTQPAHGGQGPWQQEGSGETVSACRRAVARRSRSSSFPKPGLSTAPAPHLKVSTDTIDRPEVTSGSPSALGDCASPPPARRSHGGRRHQFLSTVIVARSLARAHAPVLFLVTVLSTPGPIATYGLEQIALRNVPRLHRKGPDAVGTFLASIRRFLLVVLPHRPRPHRLRRRPRISPGSRPGISCPPSPSPPSPSPSSTAKPSRDFATVAGVIFGGLVPVSLFCLLLLLFAQRLFPRRVCSRSTRPLPHRRRHRSIRSRRQSRVRFFTLPDWKASAPPSGSLALLVISRRARFHRAPLPAGTTPPAGQGRLHHTASRISILFYILSHAIHGVFAPSLSRSPDCDPAARFRVYARAVLLTLAALFSCSPSVSPFPSSCRSSAIPSARAPPPSATCWSPNSSRSASARCCNCCS